MSSHVFYLSSIVNSCLYGNTIFQINLLNTTTSSKKRDTDSYFKQDPTHHVDMNLSGGLCTICFLRLVTAL